MPRRSYNQNCWLAQALDLIGDRWVLLVVRELLTGPKRFKDILGALPGIGTNLLSARLKEMERNGIVHRRTLPPPANAPVYDLTDFGRGLETGVMALGRWGRRAGRTPVLKRKFQPTHVLMAMKTVFRADAARGLNEAYEYRVGRDVFHVRVRRGKLDTGLGPADDPAFVMHTDAETFQRLAAGQVTLAAAEKSRRLRVEGDRKSLDRSFRIFSG